MTSIWRCWGWKLGIASSLAMCGALARVVVLLPIAFSGNCVLAQIAPDGTLGAESSVVTPTNINRLPTERIDGGATRGANLFHSFEKFSVPTGSAAYFNNASAIQNIISRVTGKSISSIDGLLQANGTANLFLLNPNGIIFGPNATLAIGGSFLGSTASSLNFADSSQFSAQAPQTTPLLTVSIPLGLQYGSNAGRVQVQGSGLQVQKSQTLALIGGDVSVEGGESGFLSAPGGRIELGGLAGAGMVEIEGQQSDGGFGLSSLRFPESVERVDVLLTNSAWVNVAASGGGSIAVNARNIDISGSSRLRGGLETNSGFLGATAGDIKLNATGAIAIANSDIFNNVRTGAVGNGGTINITAESLSLKNGAQLAASTFGRGDAGSVNITASDAVSFDRSFAFSAVQEGARGNGGGINITTGSLAVTNGAELLAYTAAQGDAGSVNINARTVSFDGVGSNALSSGAFSTVDEGAVGKGGKLNITTESLAVTNGATLSTSTRGQGDAGSVNIKARDTVFFDGVGSNGTSSTAESSVGDLPTADVAVGKGGGINITTGSLSVTNGAQLQANTRGQGNAGSVNIKARDTVSFDGVSSNGVSSRASSSVNFRAVGDGGGINITTGSLSVTNGAQLSSSTFGQGDAGNIQVSATDAIELSGTKPDPQFVSGLFTETNSSGAAGDLTITTGRLLVRDGTQVSTSTFGARDGGTLSVTASDAVEVMGRSADDQFSGGLYAQTQGAGAAGDLTITTRQLAVRDGAQVAVSSEGSRRAGDLQVLARNLLLDNRGAIRATTTSGNGGGITLQAQDLLLLRRNSNISTRAGTEQTSGTGGNITISTDNLVALENSDIDANAFGGPGGQVRINASGIFGTESREIQTSESDITATSDRGPEFSGTVEVNTPDVDPAQGLVSLPAQLVDASGLIAQTCPAGGGQGQSEFIVTGRGGLPPNPSEALSTEPVQVDWVTLNPKVENRSSPDVSTNLMSPTPVPLVEAQGWVISNKGEVVLTAQAPTVTPHSSWLPPTSCHPPQSVPRLNLTEGQ